MVQDGPLIENIPPEAFPLGTPLAEYKEGKGFSVATYIALGGGGIVVAAGIFCALTSDAGLIGYLVTALGAVGLLVGWMMLRVSQTGPVERVLVFPDGMSVSKGTKIDVFRWDDIASFIKEEGHMRVNQTRIPTEATFITLQNGASFTFRDSTFGHVGELARTLEKETLKRLLPRAEADYAAGRKLTFGPVSADKLGVTTDKGVLEWSKIGRLWIENLEFKIKEKGSLPLVDWLVAPVASVPNLNILLTLARSQGINVEGSTMGLVEFLLH